MIIEQLLRFDVPQAVVDVWLASGCTTLLPLQEEVVKRYDLFGEGNLLIQAPTSSGKTFVGEMAAIQTALRQKQAIYLVPLKALAEEKYREFDQKYRDYGLKVILSTRDHRAHDGDLERGDFSIAVVVYEKLAQLLVRRPERVAEIDLVVADELEILGDPERGAGAELLLTRLLQSRCRIIGLSAVIGNVERLADWLQADHVQSKQRPVPLHYGVLCDGEFSYRVGNGTEHGAEKLLDDGSSSTDATVIANVAQFSADGERSLIFVRAKHDTRIGAERIAERVELAPAANALAALEELPPTRSRAVLLAVMACGVAFHNADLSPEERDIVEEAFRSGEVLVLVSTSTLAVGLNLPARNVFVATEKWRYDHRLGMPWKTPVSHMEYENMGGRAGRLGMGYDFGRSILVATSPFEKELCWRRFVDGERESIEPQLARVALDDHILRLVASGHCRSIRDLASFLDQSLSGRWIWSETCTLEELNTRIRAALHRCVSHGLIAGMPDREETTVSVTPFGHAVASKGVDVDTARLLHDWVLESRQRVWSDADVLYALANSPEGRKTQVLLTTWEYDEAGYVAELRERTRHEVLEGDVPLTRLRSVRLQPFFEEVRAAKVTLFLLDWLEETAIYTIEERYNTMAGQVMAAATQLSWLVDAAQAIVCALGHEGAMSERLSRVSARLACGLSEERVALLANGGPGVTRAEAIALGAAGIDDPEQLIGLSRAVLEQWVNPKRVQGVLAWARSHGDADVWPSADVAERSGHTGDALLVIDDGRPNEISLGQQIVPLQRKQFELIRLLAQAPGECVRYETIYDNLWKDVFVEQSQMHYQKRSLLQRIQEVCPGREKGLIVTRNRYGYALNLPPDSVVIRALPANSTG